MSTVLKRFRRITTGDSWIPEIDGLRLVAILAVVCYHLGGEVFSKSGHTWQIHTWETPLMRLLANGRRGVQLFFVLSGFILGRPFANQFLLQKQAVRLKRYFARRLSRLEPPYLINLVAIWIIGSLYLHAPLGIGVKHLLASAFYLHQLIYRAPSSINGVTWTLEIEVQFYLVAPLLGQMYRLQSSTVRRAILGTLIAAGSVFSVWFFEKSLWDQPIGVLYSTVVMYIQYFLAGFLLADLYVTRRSRNKGSIVWDAVALLAWSFFFLFNASWDEAVLPVTLLVAFIATFKGTLLLRVLRVEWIAVLGGMCYSIYLWHFFFLAAVHKVSVHMVVSDKYIVTVLWQGLLTIPAILLLSTVMFLCFERPFMNPQWPQTLGNAVRNFFRRDLSAPDGV
jgi:peptidoglycan/LPS O-acetylase OafA/YrhL